MEPKFTLNTNLDTPAQKIRAVKSGTRFGLCVVLFALAGTFPVVGQTSAPSGRQFQIGPAALPDYGLQAGYVSLRSFYTREVMLNVNVSPSHGHGDGNVQVSGGLGGAIRILGIGRTIGNSAYRGFDVDVGLRFGPGLLFAFDETRSTKNQRFNLFGDLFSRLTTTFGKSTVVFFEIGFHNPSIRAGFWIPF